MTMEWIDVKDKLIPRDGTTYLCIWKGQFGLVAFDEEEDRFWLTMLPGQYDVSLLEKERERKFTYWCVLEYPNIKS